MDLSLRELERRALSGDPRAAVQYAAALKRSVVGLSVDDLWELQKAIIGELKSLEFSLWVAGSAHLLHVDKDKTLKDYLDDLSKSTGIPFPTGYLFYQEPAERKCSCAVTQVMMTGCSCGDENITQVSESSLAEPGAFYSARRTAPEEPVPTFIIQFSTEQAIVPAGLTLHQAMQLSAAHLGYDNSRTITWRRLQPRSDWIEASDTIGEEGMVYHASIQRVPPVPTALHCLTVSELHSD